MKQSKTRKVNKISFRLAAIITISCVIALALLLNIGGVKNFAEKNFSAKLNAFAEGHAFVVAQPLAEENEGVDTPTDETPDGGTDGSGQTDGSGEDGSGSGTVDPDDGNGGENNGEPDDGTVPPPVTDNENDGALDGTNTETVASASFLTKIKDFYKQYTLYVYIGAAAFVLLIVMIIVLVHRAKTKDKRRAKKEAKKLAKQQKRDAGKAAAIAAKAVAENNADAARLAALGLTGPYANLLQNGQPSPDITSMALLSAANGSPLNGYIPSTEELVRSATNGDQVDTAALYNAAYTAGLAAASSNGEEESYEDYDASAMAVGSQDADNGGYAAEDYARARDYDDDRDRRRRRRDRDDDDDYEPLRRGLARRPIAYDYYDPYDRYAAHAMAPMMRPPMAPPYAPMYPYVNPYAQSPYMPNPLMPYNPYPVSNPMMIQQPPQQQSQPQVIVVKSQQNRRPAPRRGVGGRPRRRPTSRPSGESDENLAQQIVQQLSQQQQQQQQQTQPQISYVNPYAMPVMMQPVVVQPPQVGATPVLMVQSPQAAKQAGANKQQPKAVTPATTMDATKTRNNRRRINYDGIFNSNTEEKSDVVEKK